MAVSATVTVSVGRVFAGVARNAVAVGTVVTVAAGALVDVDSGTSVG